MTEKFKISLDALPTSVNAYLKFKVQNRGSYSYVESYESKEAVAFKKYFQQKLKNEIKKQNWNIDVTSDFSKHWYLELKFRNDRAGQDTNNYYKVLMDAMTGLVYVDDQNIHARTHMSIIDKNNPGFDLVLRRVPYVGIFKNESEKDNFINNKCSDCRFFRDGKCRILQDAIEGRANPELNYDTLECEKYIKKKRK